MSRLDDPATWGVQLRHAFLNGLEQRWADTMTPGPVVLLMHGWPESWFSYRYQLKALKAAGFRAIAPFMRGYGTKTPPKNFPEYNVYTLASDMLSILAHLGVEKVALVGHDHGAATGWQLSLLHPDVFTCYFAMSIPYSGRPKTPPLTHMRSIFGDERIPENNPNFFYMLHHNLPQAADDYARDTRAALTVLYGAQNMNGTEDAPVTSPSLYVNGRSEPMWRRVVPPTKIPDWISEEEFSYYVREFERYGWEGGLNWYRVLDLNWHATPQLEGAKVTVPAAFVAGTKDIGVLMNGGIDKVRRSLANVCALPVEITFLENAGHWIQQEKAKEINELLVAFVHKHRSKFDHTSTSSTRGVTKSTTSAHKLVSRM